MKIDRKTIIRATIYEKYDGRCAYCGWKILIHEMQIDHLYPKNRGGTDSIENLNPACRVCNNWKWNFTIEEFRYEIKKQVDRCRLYSRNFRMAERYGLVSENKKPVEFYFEKER
jgi:5-methylcytosine-specific restriction endonuclease McrA